MKKFILLFFLLFSVPVAAEQIFINSEFFSGDVELMELIKDNLYNKFSLKSKINRYFLHHGYEFTRVKEIFTRKSKDELHIILDEGRINKLIIVGGQNISRILITSYLYFKQGDIFNIDTLRLQIKKMYNTGLFDDIDYIVIKARKNILVQIVEKQKSYFNVSGNYSSQYGVIPYFGYINRGIFNSQVNMNLNGEMGFLDRMNFYQINADFISKKSFFKYTHRQGRTFINEDDYSSLDEMAELGFNLYSRKYYSFSSIIPLEYNYFYEIEKFKKYNIINYFRYGLSFLFSYDNSRYVLEHREESFLNFSFNTMFFSGFESYVKLDLNAKLYQELFSYFGLIYKNSSGIITGTIPFNKMYLIGGDSLRGYPEGIYMTRQVLGNSIELEYEIIYSLLRGVLFVDTSYFYEINKNYKFLLSYGPGLILKIMSFDLQAFYGVPGNRKIYEGLFYLGLRRMIY